MADQKTDEGQKNLQNAIENKVWVDVATGKPTHNKRETGMYVNPDEIGKGLVEPALPREDLKPTHKIILRNEYDRKKITQISPYFAKTEDLHGNITEPSELNDDQDL